MHSWWNDVRFASRVLLRKPSFTAIAVVSLALGIGANTTIFTIVNELFLRSLPVEQPERLVAVYTVDRRNPGESPLSHLNWRDIREQNSVFSEFAAYDWTPLSVATGGEPFFTVGQLVSGNYFDALGIKALHGRTFSPEEDATPGSHPVAVLSYGFWKDRLGGDEALLNQTISINGSRFVVIGITPPEFGGIDIGVEPAVWIPMMMNRVVRPNLNWYEERRGLFLFAFGRLAAGVSLGPALSNLRVLGEQLERDFPNENEGRSFTAVPLAQATINPGIRDVMVAATTMLFVIVGLVLLIACANVANLLLGRASERRREIAVRLSIGASRAQLIRQLLTESVLVALLGGSLALAVASWARSALLGFLPNLPFPVDLNLDLSLDYRVLLFTLGVSLSTGFLFGLVPALQASRPSLVMALKDQSDVSFGENRRLSARNALIVGQVALSLIALLGAGLFIRSLAAAQETDPGFETRNLFAVSFDVGLQGYPPEKGQPFFRELVERVEALPGITSATLAQTGPFQGGLLRSLLLEGQAAENDRTFVGVNVIEPGYFQTLEIPILQGRALDETDREGSKRVVVVNQTMAEKFWPGQDPLGRRFTFFGDPGPVEIVGVARDIKYQSLGEGPQPYCYEPLAQRYFSNMTLLGRTAGNPAAGLNLALQELKTMDPLLPRVGANTVEEMIGNALWAPRFGASLLTIFGALALLLAAVGIYGVVSFAVLRRTREIGIRMALGARRGRVLVLILKQGMILVAVGLGLGLLAGFLLSGTLTAFLFVSPLDPVAFGATLLVLLLVALAASFIPARRATAIDPIRVLRYE